MRQVNSDHIPTLISVYYTSYAFISQMCLCLRFSDWSFVAVLIRNPQDSSVKRYQSKFQDLSHHILLLFINDDTWFPFVGTFVFLQSDYSGSSAVHTQISVWEFYEENCRRSACVLMHMSIHIPVLCMCEAVLYLLCAWRLLRTYRQAGKTKLDFVSFIFHVSKISVWCST
jgi:hypothetical protein